MLTYVTYVTKVEHTCMEIYLMVLNVMVDVGVGGFLYRAFPKIDPGCDIIVIIHSSNSSVTILWILTYSHLIFIKNNFAYHSAFLCWVFCFSF